MSHKGAFEGAIRLSKLPEGAEESFASFFVSSDA